MSGKIVLFTGGARSGKSTNAEKFIAAHASNIAYIATSQILDSEMEHRVALHRARRPQEWYTYEAPYDAHVALSEGANRYEAVLFDCLTLYVSNLLLQCLEEPDINRRFMYIMESIDKLIESAQAGSAIVVFVTNEVGAGIVPDNALAREYRDVVGVVNQKIAACADEVFLVTCGIAVDIKKLANQW